MTETAQVVLQPGRPLIEYQRSASEVPRHLTLEERDGTARVTFGVAPRWVYWMSILGPLGLGVLKTSMPLVLWIAMRSLTRHFPASPEAVENQRFFLHHVIFPLWFASLFWWAVGVRALLRYRRWGRVPRTLTASADGLVYRWLGWREISERRWHVAEITSIELRTLKNLVPGQAAADLRIHLAGRRRARRFRLTTRDPLLPAEICRALNGALFPPRSDAAHGPMLSGSA